MAKTKDALDARLNKWTAEVKELSTDAWQLLEEGLWLVTAHASRERAIEKEKFGFDIAEEVDAVDLLYSLLRDIAYPGKKIEQFKALLRR